MDTQYLHALFLRCGSVSIDTRKINAGSLFVAIRGEKFDANTFAAEALDKGAAYVIIDNKEFYIDERTVLVPDSLEALQQLAAFHRKYLGLPVVALTGSNGKTTTKELIHAVLSKKYKTTATIGNLNNHIGVPLTLLSFTDETEVGIVEMGANHQKEIEFLCSITEPDYGYITNFGKAHLEGFGGVEGVIKGKSEMYDYLSGSKKMVFVNLEDTIQVEKTQAMKKFTFGINKSEANVNITSVTADPFVAITYDGNLIQSHLIGLYNSNNISAAVTIGRFFEVSDSDIKAAIEGYIPENNRSQLLNKGTNEIILDAYNANPSSMAVAIENFVQLGKSGKIMILGDMFELGNESLSEHKALVDLLSGQKDIEVYCIGKDFYESRKSQSNLHFFEDFDAFKAMAEKADWKNKMILIKGSRGMALERTLELL